MVQKQGLQDEFYIESAGTSREEIGNDTHHGTKAKLKEMNIPFTKRHARQVTKADYDNFDYLICMDKNNLRNLARIIGTDIENKVSLLLDFANVHKDIADPWYTGNFDETYEDVVSGCKAFLTTINKL
ncbi:MAG: low molecular weight protein-tyrosine-phosphatase [Clostridia bacterium]